jgi:hypothetical protein
MSEGTDLERARAAKARLAPTIASHPAVRGIAITRTSTGYAVKVNLAYHEPRDLDLPERVGDVPVVVEVVGRIVAR